MNRVSRALGRWLARYLDQPVEHYQPFAVTEPSLLHSVLRPADVLLVEGNHRISTAIKYLTQSTWSHAALYVGDRLLKQGSGGPAGALIEADLQRGVVAVPLGKYAGYNTRVCRPVGLSAQDQDSVVDFMIGSLGKAYDLKNVLDLMRYLFPTPPIPSRLRRRMLAIGSGDPTRAICSTLIAQAFQAVKYPILPTVHRIESNHDDPTRYSQQEILHIRHHSLFAPRDFDLSPYFEIVKPTLEHGFDYQSMVWAE